MDNAATRDRLRWAAVLGLDAAAEEARMSTEPLSLTELDQRLALVRDNLRQLVEQAAGFSGAADEERMNSRIAEQQAQLDELARQRDAFLRRPA
jgi:hypothetical protein